MSLCSAALICLLFRWCETESSNEDDSPAGVIVDLSTTALERRRGIKGKGKMRKRKKRNRSWSSLRNSQKRSRIPTTHQSPSLQTKWQPSQSTVAALSPPRGSPMAKDISRRTTFRCIGYKDSHYQVIWNPLVLCTANDHTSYSHDTQ